VQGIHPQAQQALQQWAAQQSALATGGMQYAAPNGQNSHGQIQMGKPQGTLQDTTSSWAPDEFVFSPQDEEED
jgi:hypothetical protein